MSIIAIKDLSDDRNLDEADMATITGGWWQLAGLDGAAPMLQPEIAYEYPTAEGVGEQIGGLTFPIPTLQRGGSELESRLPCNKKELIYCGCLF